MTNRQLINVKKIFARTNIPRLTVALKVTAHSTTAKADFKKFYTKKVAKKFGGFIKRAYLCIAFET
jgi:hypothetical protein